MKNKVLLSTLLGGALLAGCTADDALDVKNDVAKGVNPAAPVFTVSFGNDDMTRATVGSSGLVWQMTDKMSLYHGGGDIKKTGNKWSVEKFLDTDDFLENGEVRKFDAIYSGNEGDGVADAKFTTQAMVTEGLAVMIYPADTAYAQTDKNPHIFLTNEQDEETKLQLPYVSEMLEIGEYNGKDYEHTAGFGRNYELRMRPIGSLLALKLHGKNNKKLEDAKIKTPDFKKVKIEVAAGEDGAHNPFTTEMWVKIGQKRRGEGVTDGSVKVGTNTADYKHWKYSPWIEPVDVREQIGKLAPRPSYVSTTDIENNETAYFTLLPYEDRPDFDVVIQENADKTLEAKYGKVTITIETNYGKVTMESKGGEDEEELWENNSGTKKYNIKDGLTYVLHTMFAPATKEDSELYEGQLIGTKMTHHLTVDLSDLDMNNLHISNQEDLNLALDVYKALEKTDDTRFILDGDEDGSGKFYMDQATWERVAGLMADKNNKIKFAACADEKHNTCTTIALTNNGSVDVPSFVFENTSDADNKVQPYVTIELADNTTWTFNATKDKAQVMSKVKYLVVDKKATLNLTNTYINVVNNLKAGVNDFELVNNGTVNIKKTVYLMNKMTNHGTIVIPETTTEGENRFSMDNNGQLTNREIQGKDAVMPAVTTITEGRMRSYGGVIENSGTLASVEGATNTSITNYGTINVNTSEARTLITSNADNGAEIKKPFTNEQQQTSTRDLNRFGVINLQVSGAGSNNLKIYNTNEQGFIKSVGSNANANYIVCTDNLVNGKTYVELQHPGKEVTVGTVTATAIIVPESNSFFIPADATVTASSYLYLKGSITRAGILTSGYSLKGYFGGDDSDKNNIMTF